MVAGAGQKFSGSTGTPALCISGSPSYNGGESLKAVPLPPAFIVSIHCSYLEAFPNGMFYANTGFSVAHTRRCLAVAALL
jgi:hypothetical protein